MAFIFMLILTIPAQAATRGIYGTAGLSFKDDSANCSVLIIGDNEDDAISAVTKLWQGSSCIKTWEDTAKGVLDVSHEATATKGRSYTLTVDFTVNGNSHPTVSASGTYK